MSNISHSKRCSKCGEMKQLADFYPEKRRKCGFRASCKSCSNVQSRKWMSKNPQRNKLNMLKWKMENPEMRIRSSRRWGMLNPEKRAYSSIKAQRKIKETLALCYLKNQAKQLKEKISIEQLRQRIQFKRTHNFFQFFGIGKLNINITTHEDPKQ
jgi:hypothetical protein